MAICWQRTIQAFFSRSFTYFHYFWIFPWCYTVSFLLLSISFFITAFYYYFLLSFSDLAFVVFFHCIFSYIYILLLFIFRYNACFFKDSLYYIIYTHICICWFFIFIHFFAVCFSLFIICSFFLNDLFYLLISKDITIIITVLGIIIRVVVIMFVFASLFPRIFLRYNSPLPLYLRIF